MRTVNTDRITNNSTTNASAEIAAVPVATCEAPGRKSWAWVETNSSAVTTA